MGILTSLLIGCFICYVLFELIHEYQKLRVTKYRFRFFALRDRLRMLVAFEGLSEKAPEYTIAISSLNFHISKTERASIMRILEMLTEYHTSRAEERRVEVIRHNINREDVRAIHIAFVSTTYQLILSNSRAQIACIAGAARVIRWFSNDPPETAKVVVLNPCHALNALQQHSTALQAAA